MSIEHPTLEIASCALDRAGVDAQRARYRMLAADVAGIERTETAVIVQFEASLDGELLAETLEIERRCCPFFVFDVDAVGRRVTIGVSRADQLPTLEVLASALTRDS